MPIALHNRQKKVRIDTIRLRADIKKLLRLLDLKNHEIDVQIVDDAAIREINRDYLNRDRPTNVISFAMHEGPGGGLHPEILGDIVISAETAERDAKTGDLDVMEEMEFLVIHGLLHLIGYNHENTSDAETQKMKAKEQELFFSLRGYYLD